MPVSKVTQGTFQFSLFDFLELGSSRDGGDRLFGSVGLVYLIGSMTWTRRKQIELASRRTTLLRVKGRRDKGRKYVGPQEESTALS